MEKIIFRGKKLSEVLEQLGDKEICIGANNGSGYVIYAKANEKTKIAAAFQKIYNKNKKGIPVAEGRLVSLVERNPLIEDNRIGRVKGNIEKAVDYAYRVKDLYGEINSRKAYISNFIPVLNRNVANVFVKDTENIIAVIVTGKEVGEYWFKEEFEHKNLKKAANE